MKNQITLPVLLRKLPCAGILLACFTLHGCGVVSTVASVGAAAVSVAGTAISTTAAVTSAVVTTGVAVGSAVVGAASGSAAGSSKTDESGVVIKNTEPPKP